MLGFLMACDERGIPERLLFHREAGPGLGSVVLVVGDGWTLIGLEAIRKNHFSNLPFIMNGRLSAPQPAWASPEVL
jgi:hypothetical protein